MTILDGQTAFILGASAGIAQASARLLAADGATLFLLGRSSKRLDATRDRILEHVPTAEVHLHKGDPEDEDTVKKAAQAAFDVAGRLDIVVGTVATGGTGPLVQQDLAPFTDHVMGNLRSNFLALRYGAPLMTGGGSIVFVSSTSAKTYDSSAPRLPCLQEFACETHFAFSSISLTKGIARLTRSRVARSDEKLRRDHRLFKNDAYGTVRSTL